MTSGSILTLIAIFAYLIMTVLIGVYFSRRNSGGDAGEFFIGGRTLGPVVTAMSAEASDMSSYLLMGLPGLAYFAGVAEVGWTVIGLAVGTYLNFLLVARRLRRYSGNLNAITVPGYFSRRYNDKKSLLSLVAGIVILIFFIPYTASGFKAVGTLFNSLVGLDYHVAMILGALVIIVYTVLGGFLAVSMTDLIQSIFMTIALVVVIFFAMNQAGGLAQVNSTVTALPGYLSMTQGYNQAAGTAGSFGFMSILSTLAWGLGYFGMPHILVRFMAIKDERMLVTSRRIAGIWVVLSMSAAVFIGILGYGVTAAGKIPLLTTSADSETIVVCIANLMSTKGVFLAIIAGIVLAGILAATMSTADSQLLAASSAVSQDILVDFAGVKMKKSTSMAAARGTVLAIAAIGLILAWNPNSSIFRVISFAWAGFGAAFGPAMLISLFWKRSTRQGALAGMIAGGVMVFVWKYLIAPMGGALNVYELLPAFVFSLLVNVIVSLITPAPEKEITDVWDKTFGK